MPKKNSGTFGYPGGKTTIAPWIISHFPKHKVYVEPFGGSASVLVQKEKSNVEVYNDINSDCVAFFNAIKEHSKELSEWVKNTPYSRELYETWRDEFNQGIRPSDTVEQAGRFWFLTTASFGGDIHQGGGTFSVQKSACKESHYGPTKWQRKGENVKNIRDRFHNVEIENLDWIELVDKYDGPNSFFYCDPPYVDVGEDYYTTNGGFDHVEFCDTISELEGLVLISYDHNIPEALDSWHTVRRTKEATISKQRPQKVETLTMNYDPETTPMFSETEQETLF